jgi:aminoglycoside 3-N-acetyltransferase
MINWEHVLKKIGINKGDIVLVASDVRRIAYNQIKQMGHIDLDSIIDGIYNCLGEEGTIMFPTYNWGFCKGSTFDYKNTVSKTGNLTNVALNRDDFKRSKHPIYSVAVKGKHSKEIYNLSNVESFGENSIFAFLHKNNAKMIMIDTDYNKGLTFVHYVEKTIGTEYRYNKNFTAKYIDEHGKEEVKTYSMYVRDLELNFIGDINKIGKILEDKNIAKKLVTEDGNDIISIDLSKSYSVIADDIINNKSRNLIKYL